jgi:hypothetical protein
MGLHERIQAERGVNLPATAKRQLAIPAALLRFGVIELAD